MRKTLMRILLGTCLLFSGCEDTNNLPASQPSKAENHAPIRFVPVLVKGKVKTDSYRNGVLLESDRYVFSAETEFGSKTFAYRNVNTEKVMRMDNLINPGDEITIELGEYSYGLIKESNDIISLGWDDNFVTEVNGEKVHLPY